MTDVDGILAEDAAPPKTAVRRAAEPRPSSYREAVLAGGPSYYLGLDPAWVPAPEPTATYPLAGFPLMGPATMQDWVPIEGKWHSIAYVWGDSHVPIEADGRWHYMPELYVDGVLVSLRGEFALWNRALSFAEIQAIHWDGEPQP